jgi:hypothetical protein
VSCCTHKYKIKGLGQRNWSSTEIIHGIKVFRCKDCGAVREVAGYVKPGIGALREVWKYEDAHYDFAFEPDLPSDILVRMVHHM